MTPLNLNMYQTLQSYSVRELIDAQTQDHANETYLIDVESSSSLTFSQLQTEAQGIARYLLHKGIKPGQSVAYAMHNGRTCAVTILGILYGGFRAVAVNLVAGREAIGYVLAHSEAELILTLDEHVGLIQEALVCESFNSDRAVPEIVPANQEAHGFSLNEGADNPPPVTDLFQDSIPTQSDALLMYTSGTTGQPKGVVLSQGNLISGGVNVAIAHELTINDRALCVLPLYHINGLCVTVFGPLVTASSVVFPAKFSTSGFWTWVDDYRCSWFSAVPTQIAYLLRDAGDAVSRPWLRFGRSASAPLSPDVHVNFEMRFGIPLIETMGLTETAAQILSNPMPPGKRKFGSPGVVVGDEVRVVSQQLDNVSSGEEGELLIRGPNVMQRYFKNEKATTEALVQDGWLRTGDLARMDNEGYLFITGRLKELIIKGGENIAPREIDDALYQHSDVVEAAAFARPCEQYGQCVEAAVTLRESSELTESDLMLLCEQRLGKFKCPDRIHFLTELPKGPSGKIQRQRLGGLIVG